MRFNGVLRLFKEYLNFKGSFKDVSRMLQGSFKGVTNKFQGSLKGVSRKFQECSKESSGKVKGVCVCVCGYTPITHYITERAFSIIIHIL